MCRFSNHYRYKINKFCKYVSLRSKQIVNQSNTTEVTSGCFKIHVATRIYYNLLKYTMRSY